MKTPSKGTIFLRDLEACDQFELNGRKYRVILAALNYPLRSGIWVYDRTAERSVLMRGTTEIPEDQIQLSPPIESTESFG